MREEKLRHLAYKRFNDGAKSKENAVLWVNKFVDEQGAKILNYSIEQVQRDSSTSAVDVVIFWE
jgi:hypothetical protein